VILHRRRRLHGGGGDPEAAALGNWGSVECVGVLRVQREAQVIECKLKQGRREEGEAGRGRGGRRLAIDGRRTVQA
jgi:hypothetical protein